MLLDKYANKGILPDFPLLLLKVQIFTPFILTIIQHSLPCLPRSSGRWYWGKIMFAFI